jgi:hypothetical protein
MKPLPQTYTASSADSDGTRRIQSTAENMPVAEAEWTMEAIEWRANYVGPVLEDILHQMEEHWQRSLDVEI